MRMIRTFNYPLYPTDSQETELINILIACQCLYNAALSQRIDAYKKQGKNLTKFDQQKDLTALRKFDESYGRIATTILRSSLTRLDIAYKGFYTRVKHGAVPGFPRYRSQSRYDSFSFPQPIIEANRVSVPKLGVIKFRNYRDIRGIPVEARVLRTAKGWMFSVVCDLGPAPGKIEIKTSTGVDVGLTHFATLATGEQIENPRFYQKSEALLAYRQQKLATKQKNSRSRLTAKRLVGKIHERIRNQRLDFLRKLAKILVTKYDLIAYEDLQIKNMVRGNLAKSIYDASWGIFINCIKSKAEEAGKYAIGVNPRGTSQRCSRCAHVPVERKTLADRVHFCESCKLRIDRDYNAAINIHALGWSAVMPSAAALGPTEAIGVQ